MEFGDNVTFGNGGGEMGVYDVYGDKLTDIVSGQAHSWGLNWFEQKKGPIVRRSYKYQHKSVANDLYWKNQLRWEAWEVIPPES